MRDRLATIRMGQKLGAVPLWGRELGPHLAQCGHGRGLPPYQEASGILIHPAVWLQQTWPKIGAVLL